MTVILRTAARFSNPALPTLSSLGFMSSVGLKGLYLIQAADPYADASGNGNALAQFGSVALPTFSGGVFQFREASAQQALSTGILCGSPNRTWFAAFQIVAAGNSGASTAMSHAGGIGGGKSYGLSAFSGSAGADFSLWAQGGNVAMGFPSGGVGSFNVLCMRSDSAKANSFVNGTNKQTVTYSTADTTSTPQPFPIGFGMETVRAVNMDLAFAAVYEGRTFTDAEVASAQIAIRRFLASKSITVP